LALIYAFQILSNTPSPFMWALMRYFVRDVDELVLVRKILNSFIFYSDKDVGSKKHLISFLNLHSLNFCAKSAFND